MLYPTELRARMPVFTVFSLLGPARKPRRCTAPTPSGAFDGDPMVPEHVQTLAHASRAEGSARARVDTSATPEVSPTSRARKREAAGSSQRWSDVVVDRGVPHWVEVADGMAAEARGQIARVLAQIDATLEMLRSDRTRLLQVLVFIAEGMTPPFSTNCGMREFRPPILPDGRWCGWASAHPAGSRWSSPPRFRKRDRAGVR